VGRVGAQQRHLGLVERGELDAERAHPVDEAGDTRAAVAAAHHATCTTQQATGNAQHARCNARHAMCKAQQAKGDMCHHTASDSHHN
jgi:hypothetical protein